MLPTQQQSTRHQQHDDSNNNINNSNKKASTTTAAPPTRISVFVCTRHCYNAGLVIREHITCKQQQQHQQQRPQRQQQRQPSTASRSALHLRQPQWQQVTTASSAAAFLSTTCNLPVAAFPCKEQASEELEDKPLKPAAGQGSLFGCELPSTVGKLGLAVPLRNQQGVKIKGTRQHCKVHQRPRSPLALLHHWRWHQGYSGLEGAWRSEGEA